MRGFGVASTVAAAVASTSYFVSNVVAQSVTEVDPIVIKGSKFFYKSNGTQFYMRGVAYQQDTSGGGGEIDVSVSTDYKDPLADPDSCERDIPYLIDLRTNIIRVYAIDPTEDHDQCMSMLADAGIYVIADLSQPGLSINRDSPAWDDDLYARYASVVDEMAQYTNTMGFFAGNEVANQPNNTQASAFVKAAVRDTKAYIAQQDYREIGVGYATNDDAEIREAMADYFNCGDQSDAIDFWGYNIYSWCGDSSFSESGYDERTEEFEGYSVPVFFAEYGCNEVEPREFGDVPALYGPQMNDVWSGGIVYMYFQEENDYGLVSVSGDTVSTLADYDNYSSQMQKATPTGVNMDDYSPSNSPTACPSTDSDWRAVATPLPPTPNKELCQCMYNSLSCVVASDIDSEDYGDLFGTVCGLGDDVCAGIQANGSTGDYGAYSMCNSTEQLAFVLNEYYQAQDENQSACDFSGSATTKPTQSLGSNCERLVSQAQGGTGTVTAQVTQTGAGDAGSGSSGSSGSDSDNDDSDDSDSAGNMLGVPMYSNGLVQFGAYAFVAVATGMGMILL